MKPAVVYLRVSTTRQGRDGLGIEAQRATIANFMEQNGFEGATEFVDDTTGGDTTPRHADDAGSIRLTLNRRPVLRAALDEAKRLGAPLIVAKLDRLSRDAGFVHAIMQWRVRIIVTSLGPEVDPFMLGIYAQLAEQERRMISERTKAALAAAKTRGVKLGTYGKTQARRNKATAKATAVSMKPVIAALKNEGFATQRAICEELNRRGITTPRDKKWHLSTVAVLMLRIEGKRK